MLDDERWKQFEEEGFVNIGVVDDVSKLKQRIDDIMLGKAPTEGLLMQLDSETGNYSDLGEQSIGWKGATLNYRKIQNLEKDRLFLEYTQHPIFKEVCRRVYGNVDITSFRAMFFNKPAGKGTHLPWHQDRWGHLDQDPLLTIWTALDPATTENGCVQVIPGSHKLGIVNPEHHSAFLTEEQAEKICLNEKIFSLEAKEGEVFLLHNWLIHRSGTNSREDLARRAFSVNYMDARTQVLHENMNRPEPNAVAFPIIFQAD